MKTLDATPGHDEVVVPEDTVDRRTAASIEPAFQALLNRSAVARELQLGTWLERGTTALNSTCIAHDGHGKWIIGNG